ncbi:hypothetical protein NFI96_025212, partial [Prochilodus magdalenae]
MQDDSHDCLEVGGVSKRGEPMESLKQGIYNEGFTGSLDSLNVISSEDLKSKTADAEELIKSSNHEGTQIYNDPLKKEDNQTQNDGQILQDDPLKDANKALSTDNSTCNAKDSLPNNNKTGRPGTVSQTSSSKGTHDPKQLTIELGTAQQKSVPEPLKVCTSLRTSSTTQKGTETHNTSTLNELSSSCPPHSESNGECRTSSSGPSEGFGTLSVQQDGEILGRPKHRKKRQRRSTNEGVCCCYRAVRQAFLRCLEETSIVVPGLVLTILFCVTIIIIIPTTGRSISAHVGALSVVCIVLCLCVPVLVSLPCLPALRRCEKSLALSIWTALFIIAIVFIFTGGVVTAWEQVAFFLYLSLSVYTILPLTLAWALIFGIGVSICHIVIISVYVSVTSPGTRDLAVQ